MSFPSLSAATYGHGKVIQINPRPGRFAPIGSAFPTAGDTVEDTRKNTGFVSDCLPANAKLENLATIGEALRAFLHPLNQCAVFVVRDPSDYDDLLRYYYEALREICTTVTGLGANQGVDLTLLHASIDAAKFFIMEHNNRIIYEKGHWRVTHPFSWMRKSLRADPKGLLSNVGKAIVSPVTKLVRILRKDDAHLDVVPHHLRI